jgi:hypothetical protein
MERATYFLGCEGIVSKRLGSPYRSGRADCWVKVKNPAAPAVRRKPRKIGAGSGMDDDAPPLSAALATAFGEQNSVKSNWL